MSDTSTFKTRGVHHIGLTVPDVQATRRFFLDTLKFQQLGEVPEYPAVFVSDGTTMITLWQATNPEHAVSFDRKNVIGLHHLAFTVDNSAALDAVYHELEQLPEVAIEFPPSPLHDGPTRHMMCHIPGGIRVEFIAPAA